MGGIEHQWEGGSGLGACAVVSRHTNDLEFGEEGVSFCFFGVGKGLSERVALLLLWEGVVVGIGSLTLKTVTSSNQGVQAPLVHFPKRY